MYDYVSGALVERRPDRVVVDVGGVGWRLLIPLSTYERLPAREGSRVRLLVVHHQREDRQALFGFGTAEERQFFETVTSVSGVGPSLALAMLSGMAFGEFRASVAAGDAAALTRIKGVGKKLAGRILVELTEAMKGFGPLAGPTPGLPPGASDAALALVALGFDRREAEKRAAEAAGDLPPDTPPGDVVREALQRARR